MQRSDENKRKLSEQLRVQWVSQIEFESKLRLAQAHKIHAENPQGIGNFKSVKVQRIRQYSK